MDPDERDVLSRAIGNGSVVFPARVRKGWEHTKIDGTQREFILDREACCEALRRIGQVPWQSINADDKSLAEQIRENCVHALTVMRDSMARNEERMI